MKNKFIVLAVVMLGIVTVIPAVSNAQINQAAASFQAQITNATVKVSDIDNSIRKISRDDSDKNKNESEDKEKNKGKDNEKEKNRKAICYSTRNLQIGFTGNDVIALNNFLNKEGYNTEANSNVFSEKTQIALKAYQEKNPGILKEAGLTAGNGILGNITRKYFCNNGNGPSSNSNSVLLGHPKFDDDNDEDEDHDKPRPTPVPTPAYNADINHDGSVNVEDLLMVINAWGKCPVVTVSDTARIANPCPADINGDKVVDRTDLNLVIKYWGQVTTTVRSSVTVTSPDSTNVIWKTGETKTITWTSQNIVNGSIGLFIIDGNGHSYDLGRNPTQNDGTQEIVVPQIPSSKYRVYIKEYTKGVFDYSDNYFEVVSTSQAVIGDANGDKIVNVDDILVVISHWGSCPSSNDPAAGRPIGCAGDLNGDGLVNQADLTIVQNNWTQTPTTKDTI